MNPELRFKDSFGTDFPDWKEKKIKEIGKVAMCKRIFKEQTLDFGEIPFFKIGTFGDAPDAYITRELFEEFKKKYPYPQKGYILISASGSIGKLVEYDGEDAYFQDSNIIWLEHKSDVLDKYLKQVYSTLDWEEGLEGSTIKRLYNKVFLNKIIYIPQVPEQEKISKLLSDIDEKIVKQAIIVKKLKNTKDAMLVKMFPQEHSKVPEIRFEGFSGDWEEKKLGDICYQIGDGLHGTPKYVKKSNYIFINGNNLSDGKIIVGDDCLYVGDKTYVDNNKQLDDNTILMSINGTIGKLAYYNNEKVMLGKSVCYLKIKEAISKEIVYVILQTSRVINNFLESLTGTTIKNLGLTVIKKTNILLPKEKKEQEKIGQFFSDLDKKIEINQKKYDKLCDVKKALLSKLLPTKEDE